MLDGSDAGEGILFRLVVLDAAECHDQGSCGVLALGLGFFRWEIDFDPLDLGSMIDIFRRV